MIVEVVHEVLLPSSAELDLELAQVRANWLRPRNELPLRDDTVVASYCVHVVLVVDLEQQVLDGVVVWAVLVLQLVDLVEDQLNFWNAVGRTDPELLLRILEALGFDVFDLVNTVVSLLTPLELLVEEVKHREVETPEVVTAGQVDVVVCVQRRERDRATEVGLLAFGHDLHVVVQVLLRQAEIDDENATVLLAQNEVARLDVAVNKTAIVHLLNCDEHLEQNVNRYLKIIRLLQTTPGPSQVDPEEVHNDKVLFRILDEVIHAGNVLEPCSHVRRK